MLTLVVDTLYWVDSLLHRCIKSSLCKLGTFGLKLALLLKIALFELKLSIAASFGQK